ncbi:permease family-domain-containing protein [Phellopilus nigrolimitatus]|nr:permease family-domain-containing protein [Phellopilus nigrolimitatus]
MITFVDRLNARVAASALGYWFHLEGSGHPRQRVGSRFLTELRAGITTWAAMAYIISVNATIISDSGGPCVCPATSTDACASDSDYLVCVNDVRRDIITATAASASLASCLMGLLANIPVGMAPGLGLNAYFAYSIVGFHGTGTTSYKEALAAIFLEGWIFFALSLLGVRQWLARAMPHSLVMAVGAGIGLYIAFIGLSSGGLFVVGGDTTNLVGLGGCNAEDFVEGLSDFCAKRVMQNPTTWLGIFVGGILTVFLMLYRVRGSILIGIFLVSIISWPRDTPVTYFPRTPSGDDLFDFFKQVVTFRPLQLTGAAIDWESYKTGRVWYALITFLYVDILDTTGTLYSMAKFAGLRDPVTMDFENSTVAYCVDAFSISMGALMGTSPVTAFIESATGISEGGKTGITAITCGIMFFISIFFAPIFSSIPSWATGGALVIVGSLMIRNVREINWDYIGDSVPAFLTLILIPLTYNIAYGVIAGIISYILLNGIPFLLRKLTGDRLVPHLYDLGEQWSVPPGGFAPLWMRNAARGHWKIWEDDAAMQARTMHPQMVGRAGDEKARADDGRTYSGGSYNGEPYTGGPYTAERGERLPQLHRTVSIETEDRSSSMSPMVKRGTEPPSPSSMIYPPRKFA